MTYESKIINIDFRAIFSIDVQSKSIINFCWLLFRISNKHDFYLQRFEPKRKIISFFDHFDNTRSGMENSHLYIEPFSFRALLKLTLTYVTLVKGN